MCSRVEMERVNVGRLMRTVAHLKPRQVWFQVWRRVQKKLGPHPACGCGELPAFTFLNLQARPRGWNDTSLDLLWRYNLHYFDKGQELIGRWIAENPRGSFPGWDPYPTSLRIVNWVKWLEANPGAADRERMKDSLRLQLEWLSGHVEWHLLANHLLANLKALVIGSRYLGRAEGKWMRLYKEQMEEQILPDGGHFERSVMYHAIVLEDALDVLHFCETREAAWLHPVVERMLAYLVDMTGPDGKIVMFNDAADGIAKSTRALCDEAARLGIKVPETRAFADFPQTGYARMTAGDFVLFVDAAPIGPDYQPGHAHADTLTYELYYKGVKVVSDAGTSAYRGMRRAFERSTAAHNVVEVDGRDSSEVWSSHRVGSRAKIVSRTVDPTHISAAYNGNGGCVRRRFELTGNGLTITDHVSSGDACVTRVHFAPGKECVLQLEMAGVEWGRYACAQEFGKVAEAAVASASFGADREFAYRLTVGK